METLPGGEWQDLRPHEKFIRVRAAQRRRCNEGSTKGLHLTASETTDFWGLCGELVVSLDIGWSLMSIIEHGDPGYDFCEYGITYDAKGTKHWSRQSLLSPVNVPLRSDVYILVAINWDMRMGKIVGWALNHQLANAPVRTHGRHKIPTRTIPTSRLVEWGQIGWPPMVVVDGG